MEFAPGYYESRIRELENRINSLVAATDPTPWTDFPAFVASWGRGTGGYAQYRKTLSGLQYTMNLHLVGTPTDGTVILAAGWAPDSSYYPTVAGKAVPVAIDTMGAAFYSTNHSPFLVFRTDGSLVIYGLNATGLGKLEAHGIIPLT